MTSVPRVRSFRPARESRQAGWRYLLEPSDSGAANRAARDSAARARAPQANAATPGGQPRPVATRRQRGRRPEYGSTLVIARSRDRHRASHQRRPRLRVRRQREVAWLHRRLARRREGRRVCDVASERSDEIALLAGRGATSSSRSTAPARQAAFVSDRDDFGKEHPRFTLYYANLKSPARRRS